MASTEDTRRRRRPGRRRPRPGPGPAPATDAPSSQVDCAVYVDGRRTSDDAGSDALESARTRGGFVWLGLHEPTEAEFEPIAERYGLHPLAVEDAVHGHQRPKLERYDDSLFLVLTTAHYVEHETLTATSEVVETGEVMVFVVRDAVITVRHGAHGHLSDLRHSLEQQPELLAEGPAAVLYAVADAVVDGYVEVAVAMEEDVDELETSVFSPEQSDDLGRLYHLKRELMALRRAAAPLDLPLSHLAEREVAGVPESMRSYFRDVHDHVLRVREQVAALDETLTSILDVSVARTGLSDNQDMRKISAWAGIIAVPTFVAGVYGMNFASMPELQWRWGYPACLLLMAVISVLLWRGFKRSGWL